MANFLKYLCCVYRVCFDIIACVFCWRGFFVVVETYLHGYWISLCGFSTGQNLLSDCILSFRFCNYRNKFHFLVFWKRWEMFLHESSHENASFFQPSAKKNNDFIRKWWHVKEKMQRWNVLLNQNTKEREPKERGKKCECENRHNVIIKKGELKSADWWYEKEKWHS